MKQVEVPFWAHSLSAFSRFQKRTSHVGGTRHIGFKTSFSKKRENQYEWILQQAEERDWYVDTIVCPPNKIDNAVYGQGLNLLEVELFASILNRHMRTWQHHGPSHWTLAMSMKNASQIVSLNG